MRFFSESLGKRDRSGFSSGNERIDRYFQESVSQDIKRRYARCYVLVEQETEKIAGFYTLSSHSVPLSDFDPQTIKSLPRYPSIPTVLIGWLGRDLAFRGQSVGALLLADAVARLTHSPAGIHAICADAIDDVAADFYQHHQFMPLLSRPFSFFLPMKTALNLFVAE